jgi:hypothetical protein
MPGKKGRQLYERSDVVRPELKVLYMSGYTHHVIAHRGMLDRGSVYPETFSVQALVQKVKEVLVTCAG